MRKSATLLHDREGATIVEFALIAPVLLLMLMGMFDMGYNYYIQSQLQGAVQKAARDSTIEGAAGKTTQIDLRVKEAVHELVPGATLTFSRKSYARFSDVLQPEDYDDVNEDNICNDGEPFEDANGNGTWDDDRGSAGLGGARDAVLYLVDVRYDRLFGMVGMAGLPSEVRTQATTVLRNQPYGEQAISAAVGNCL